MQGMIGNYLQMIAAGTVHPSFPENRFAGGTGGGVIFSMKKCMLGWLFRDQGIFQNIDQHILRLSI